MKRALGYARVSGKSQETDGTGLEEQVVRITDWATKNGYEIVEWFKDSITGELPWDKRPAMTALVNRLALNGIEAVLVHQMDRVGRGKSGVFESFYEMAEAAGVQVISTVDGLLTEDADADVFKSADAEMIRTIKQAIVRQEKRKLVARMALGKMRAKAANPAHRTDGKYGFGSHPAYPAEQATLVRMRQLESTGLTFYRIAKILNVEGLKPRQADKWSGTAVGKILERGKTNAKQPKHEERQGSNRTVAGDAKAEA